MIEQPAIVFDMGMVLVAPINLYSDLGRLLGVAPERMRAVYESHRRAYDAGLPDRDYWSRTAAELGLGPQTLADGQLEALVSADIAAWSVIRPAAAALLAGLGRAGRTVVVLSNAPTSFALRARDLPWRHLAERWFFSAELGLTKPDPAIYRHVEQALKRPPEQLWFVDDRPENVDQASARGWRAHLWRDDQDTRAWLESAGLLPRD
ncbi:MAG: HAD-IA family hydrolase [Propionibacteriaceae bacterium]|jgi:putative hydrolase of the HAD superfamily|nr:HAD-IA family hydrolase [Propionibacteriaceae bacterium]